MRPKFTIPTIIALTAVFAVPKPAEAGCDRGISGVATPRSVVCAENKSRDLYCAPVDDLGNFELIEGKVAPSTTNDCLPIHGVFDVYEINCPWRAAAINRNDPTRAFGGPWLDIRCNPCDQLDLRCGPGFCVNGGYCDGPNCPETGVCHAPDSPISLMMCGGSVFDPNQCFGCTPHTMSLTSGVDDFFSGANGTESPSPSVGLVNWVNANYGLPGIRNYDAGHQNQYFAHTFTGLQPPEGKEICGARLTTRIQRNDENDAFRFRFYDEAGNPVAPGWDNVLGGNGGLGIPLGGSAVLNFDIGGLPGGPGMLAQMESGGWLDILVQDDSAVDFLTLEVDYCCRCDPHDTLSVAGVIDNFSTGNGVESPGPSANLLNYMSVNWNVGAPRNFDSSGQNHWFGHTFTGLAPEDGAYICDATFGAVVSSEGDNDATWLFFSNAVGWRDGPLHSAVLSTLGVPGNTTGPISINIGSLPNGLAYLAQMELGFLDWVVQDDTAIDYGTLQVSYCCGPSPNPDPVYGPTYNPNPNPNPNPTPNPNPDPVDPPGTENPN